MGVWSGQDRYTDWFLVRRAAASEPTASLGTEVGLLTYGNVKILPALGGTHPEFTQLYGFVETLGPGNQGNVRYQISNNGTNWYYHDAGTGNWTVVGDDGVHNNTASQVHSFLPKFVTDVGTGEFYFKAANDFNKASSDAIWIIIDRHFLRAPQGREL
jgi:hypothetical protein